jgi:hypothetical protein
LFDSLTGVELWVFRIIIFGKTFWQQKFQKYLQSYHIHQELGHSDLIYLNKFQSSTGSSLGIKKTKITNQTQYLKLIISLPNLLRPGESSWASPGFLSWQANKVFRRAPRATARTIFVSLFIIKLRLKEINKDLMGSPFNK